MDVGGAQGKNAFLQGGSGNFSACFDVPILTVFVFYVFNDDI